MIEIMIFVLPTIISLIIHDYLNNREKTIYSVIKTFGGYCCINSLICMMILFFYQKNEIYLNEHIYRLNFVFKYFTLSFIIATVLPIITEFIKRNVTIKFIFKEVKNEEKN